MFFSLFFTKCQKIRCLPTIGRFLIEWFCFFYIELNAIGKVNRQRLGAHIRILRYHLPGRSSVQETISVLVKNTIIFYSLQFIELQNFLLNNYYFYINIIITQTNHYIDLPRYMVRRLLSANTKAYQLAATLASKSPPQLAGSPVTSLLV